MSSHSRTTVTRDASGAPHVQAPSPLDEQSLYGNSALASWLGPAEDPFGPYSDVWGPSASEQADKQAQFELDPAWKDLSEEQRQKALNSGPGTGFAATRIGRHYGLQTNVPQMTQAERDQVLDLSTDDGRLGALSQMRQNANPLDPNGAMRCGASSLVGGALYGGGKQGLKTLLDSMAADRKKAGLPPLAGEDLDLIRKKLDDPAAKLTMGDLDVLQQQTYDHFRAGKDGLNGRGMKDFIQNHKGMKDMFAAKDMGLDGIDLSGDGRSEHLVLGIGRDRNGNRRMVYDPQARQDKEGWGDYMDSAKVEALHYEERAKMQARFDAVNARAGDEKFDYAKEIDKLNAELDANVRMRQYAYKHDSQLITDQGELRDYAQATDYRVGAKGIEEHDAQTAAGPRKGW